MLAIKTPTLQHVFSPIYISFFCFDSISTVIACCCNIGLCIFCIPIYNTWFLVIFIMECSRNCLSVYSD